MQIRLMADPEIERPLVGGDAALRRRSLMSIRLTIRCICLGLVSPAVAFAERTKPADNSGNKSAHAPRAKHGRRMTVKKFNKMLRMKHERRRQPKPKG
jgi:hypothetical protein